MSLSDVHIVKDEYLILPEFEGIRRKGRLFFKAILIFVSYSFQLLVDLLYNDTNLSISWVLFLPF